VLNALDGLAGVGMLDTAQRRELGRLRPQRRTRPPPHADDRERRRANARVRRRARPGLLPTRGGVVRHAAVGLRAVGRRRARSRIGARPLGPRPRGRQGRRVADPAAAGSGQEAGVGSRRCERGARPPHGRRARPRAPPARRARRGWPTARCRSARARRRLAPGGRTCSVSRRSTLAWAWSMRRVNSSRRRRRSRRPSDSASSRAVSRAARTFARCSSTTPA
jgi:hypothetical protein